MLFFRQIIARDCRRKMPSCPFHLKTMDSLPLSQNKKPFPLLIPWSNSENMWQPFPIMLSGFLRKIVQFFKNALISDPKLSFHNLIKISTSMWLAIQLQNQFGTNTTIFVGDNFSFTFRSNSSNLRLCLATPSEMGGWTCWSSFQLKKGGS